MDRPFRVLIGTPCGGGQLSVQYMLSLLATYQQIQEIKKSLFIRSQLRIAKEQGLINQIQLQNLEQLEKMNLIDFEVGLYTLSNESLLTRGRNHIAAVAIRQGWDKLFFIDADAQWTPEQFFKVACAPHDFAAGACPLKVLPIHLNFLPFKDDDHYYPENIRSVDSLLKMKDGYKSDFVPVAYVGTAFMALSRKVLLQTAALAEEYQYPNPSTGLLHTNWNMFATKPMHGKFMSEDWYMCEQARSLGFEVMLCADVIISHVGTMVYTPQMAVITHQTSPQPQLAGAI